MENELKCEILASVMNQADIRHMIEVFNVGEKDHCIIINQITKKYLKAQDLSKGYHKFFSFAERGLSKSRNRALEYAAGDICIICDDDCHFEPEYKKIILNAHKSHPEADIITFDFVHPDKTRKTMKEGKVGFLRSMKISSTQITFKRESIQKSRIRFDENFGTGSGKYNWGEENIFLFDCLRAGLKIYHVPIIIIRKSDYGTTWDRSNTPDHYRQQGAIFCRMSSKFWRILALQFAIRKRKIYGKDMCGLDVYRSMIKGAKAYKKERKNV